MMQQGDFSFFKTNRYKGTLCLSTAGFFYLFLVFFLPFGVDNYNPNHEYSVDFLIEISHFFLAVLFVILFNEFIFQPIFKLSISTRFIFLWNIWTLFFLSSIIFLIYNILGEWHDFKVTSYLSFLINASSVLLFPLLGTFFVFRHFHLRSQIEEILMHQEDKIDPQSLITFSGRGSKDYISLTISKFLYGQAQDNYVALYYLENGQIKQFLIRTSLNRLVQSVRHPIVSRTHRSYMVNLYQVSKVNGGLQNTFLLLGPKEIEIPVSVSYRTEVIDQLKKAKELVLPPIAAFHHK